jgi:hypothetical protein
VTGIIEGKLDAITFLLGIESRLEDATVLSTIGFFFSERIVF